MSRGPVDVLVLAAHPDDAEIGCGGTILDLVAGGSEVAIVDFTRGEKGTLGSPEQRAEEAAKAARLLGIRERVNLGLPDTELRDDDDAVGRVVAEIRALRPRVLVAPVDQDVHPDHVATSRIARRAFFHSGLRNVRPDLGGPHRPERLVYYAGNDQISPSFCVDISARIQQKRAVVSCYHSQVTGSDAHRVRKLDVLARCEARDRYFGSLCGLEAAEPFLVEGPLAFDGLMQIVPGRE